MKTKLFMLLLGCKPHGRLIEQHDIFFGVGKDLKELIPQINEFWPEASGKIHVDAWREITAVDTNRVSIQQREANFDMRASQALNKLFFINLGGYKKDIFDEFHYKMLIVAQSLAEAIVQAKETYFFKTTGFIGAPSHVDDKYGIDVDDAYAVEDLFSEEIKQQYKLLVNDNVRVSADQIHLGYLKLSNLA